MQTWTYLDVPEAPRVRAWLDAQPEAAALVLLAEADAGRLSDIQAAFAEAGRPLLGAVFPELIVDAGFVRQGALFLPLNPGGAWRLVEGLDGGAASVEAAVEGLVELVDAQGGAPGTHTLFLVFDGMVGNIASLIQALYAQLGDQVHYAGVNAGSETFQPMPCLFEGGRVVGNAVLALVLSDHPGAVLEHGYSVQGQTLVASSTTGNRIGQIGWQPAFEQYRAMARAAGGIEVDRENFYQTAVHFPFGLVRADGEVLVRIPVGLSDDGAIYCVGEIPENGLLALVSAVEPGSMRTVEALAERLGAVTAGEVCLFYCAGRRMHLQAAASAELAELRQRLGRPLFGALSLGEIGNSREGGYALFHNATLVGLPWPALPAR